MGRGTFKFICQNEDCKADNWLTRSERGSANIPRCSSCGSTWLEASNARKQIIDTRDASRERAKMDNKKMGKE